MTLSIVACIPLCNGEPFIKSCLASILAQSRQPDEIVIVDDGSNDKGAEVAAEVLRGDGRVKILRKENGGQSSARNMAVMHSTSSHIAFLDQDDWWYPRHLEALERAALRHTLDGPFGWVYSDLDEYDYSGRLQVRQFLKRKDTEHPKRTIHSCLAQDMYVLPSASLISRHAFEAVGGFDERLSGYEDDDLFLRLFLAGYTNVFLREALSAWRIHSGSASYSIRMTNSAIIYVDKLFELFPDDVAMHRYFGRDLISSRFLHRAVANYALAAQTGNDDMMSASLRLVDRVLPKLPWRLRIMFRALRPFLGLRGMHTLASRRQFRQIGKLVLGFGATSRPFRI